MDNVYWSNRRANSQISDGCLLNPIKKEAKRDWHNMLNLIPIYILYTYNNLNVNHFFLLFSNNENMFKKKKWKFSKENF